MPRLTVTPMLALLLAALIAAVGVVDVTVACRHPFDTSLDVPDPKHGAGTHCWRGIPYASPPVGSLRWAKPVPLKPLTTLPASPGQYSAACMQQLTTTPTPPWYTKLSEDCLYLNVFAPTTRAAKLPVMVFIHGGSYTSGTAAIPIYGGQDFITQTNNTVIVTINYRLGVFGFLGSQDSLQEQNTTGNFGLFDMIESLRWVQRNIHLWNGDADRVTVFGESAGAFAICALTVTPLAKGLFHRAIMESGNCRSALTLQRTHQVATSVSTTLGCQQGTSAKKRLACLRAKSSAALLKAAQVVPGLGGVDRWAATIDNTLLKASPLDTMRHTGVRADVTEVMFGTNLHEGRFFTVTPPAFRHLPASQFVGAMQLILAPHLPPAKILKVAAFYANMSIPNDAKAANLTSFAALRLGQMITDSTFVCPSLWAARAVDRAQQQQQQQQQRTRTYMYQFAYTPTCTFSFVPKDLWPITGAQHVAEVPFVLDTRANRHCKKNDVGHALAFAMVDMWQAFAATGDPNPAADVPTWGTFPRNFTWAPFTADAESGSNAAMSRKTTASSASSASSAPREALAVLNAPLSTTDHYRADVCKWWADLFGDAL